MILQEKTRPVIKVALKMIGNHETQFDRNLKLKSVGNFFQAKKDGMGARCLIFIIAILIMFLKLLLAPLCREYCIF